MITDATNVTITVNWIHQPAIATEYITVRQDDYDCALNALRWLRDARPWAYGRLGEAQRAQLESMLAREEMPTFQQTWEVKKMSALLAEQEQREEEVERG